MNNDAPKCYATGHPISNAVMLAFSQGCGGQVVPPYRLLDGPAVLYGFLRGTDLIYRHCKWIGREFYYIDHGYIGHKHFDGFYRVTRSGLQARLVEAKSRTFADDRWRALGVALRPWRKAGSHVMVCPPSKAFSQFQGIDSSDWVQVVVAEVQRHTERPITIRPKPAGRDDVKLLSQLEDCWCLVTDSSNAAVEAIIGGVPAVVLGESAAKSVGWTFADIEAPRWADREPWAHALAYHQFTLEEMQNGIAWEHCQRQII